MMETFTIDPRRWRIARIFGRNPLLRRVDRVEAVVTLVALLASLVAIPVAGVVGAVAYDVRAHLYAQEAQERHLVTGTVADAKRTDPGTTAQARWPATVGKRTGTLQPGAPAKAGETTELWVDKDGTPAPPPTPTWRAVADGIGIAVAIALMVALGMASLVAGVRSWLDRICDVHWDRELRSLVDDGGRASRQ